MKKRIWNQLKKAALVAVFAGLMGNCAVSAAEFDTQELTVPEVQIGQSAQWTDQENFQAELRLEVSGLRELYRKAQEDGGEDSQKDVHEGQLDNLQGDDEQMDEENPADAASAAENTSQDEEEQVTELL